LQYQTRLILQAFMQLARRALVEPARRASSSSQLHRVNGVLVGGTSMWTCLAATWPQYSNPRSQA